MIYPQTPPVYPTYQPQEYIHVPPQHAESQSPSHRRNPQVVAITIEDELYLNRERMNYKRNQQIRRNRTYRQVIFIDTYSYSRRGRPYNPDFMWYCCYDTSLNCCDNCLIWIYFCGLWPVRCLFYTLYHLVKCVCDPLCDNWLSFSDCCLNILGRCRSGIGNICACFYDICTQSLSFICTPCAYCFREGKDACCCLCNHMGDAFCSCWSGFVSCGLWDCIGNCCTDCAGLVWSTGGAVMNVLDCCFRNGLFVFFDMCNKCLDVVLMVLQGLGESVCNVLCNVLCMCFQ